MDADELKQALERLEALVRKAADRAATLIKDAEDADQRAADLHKAQEHHRAAADELLDRAQAAAEALAGQVGDHRDAIAERVKAVARAGNAVSETLREATDQRLPESRGHAEAALEEQLHHLRPDVRVLVGLIQELQHHFTGATASGHDGTL